uniref:Uncharacterized protein n=1 Tax=Aegilops tauschii subsp. strangulata TaxID=200361 RepID=A0A453I820_AEGTS
ATTSLMGPASPCRSAPRASSHMPSYDSLDLSVQLELRGIPTQAWHLSTAEHLLGSSCWIERLHPSTRSRADLATFRLTARTRDPASIRRAAILEIVELVTARD